MVKARIFLSLTSMTALMLATCSTGNSEVSSDNPNNNGDDGGNTSAYVIIFDNANPAPVLRAGLLAAGG